MPIPTDEQIHVFYKRMIASKVDEAEQKFKDGEITIQEYRDVLFWGSKFQAAYETYLDAKNRLLETIITYQAEMKDKVN